MRVSSGPAGVSRPSCPPEARTAYRHDTAVPATSQPAHQFTSPGNFAVGVGPIHCFSFLR